MRKQEDCWAWHHERNGLFTVRSAYMMLIETKKNREDYLESRGNCSDVQRIQNEWKHLWSMKIPSKIKVFCWRLAHNSLPTGTILKNKNLTATANCKICGAEEDTWIHSLLQCNISKCVWALMDEDLLDLLASLHFSDPKHWISYICCNIPKADGVRILVTCWAIWYARRKAIHDRIFQSPLSIMMMTNRLIEEFEFIQEIDFKEKDHYQNKSTQNLISPQNGISKINTDAAIDRSGTKGVVAVVCRTDQGEFVAASAMVIPYIINPETLEAMAC